LAGQYSHLLITKFNVQTSFAASLVRLAASWLNARLELFERYCLPSVAGQKGAEFRWIVFFDAASPAWFKQKISTYAPLVYPIYIDGPVSDELIAHSILHTGLASLPYLITTRLDNDDAISMDHLASVQSVFHQQEREFITFPLGLQSFRGHLYTVYWPNNPFLSLIERVGDDGRFTTVFCVPHDHVGQAGKLRRVHRTCQWMQVLHDSNIGNTLRGWPRLSSRSHPNFQSVSPHEPTSDSIAARVRFSAKCHMASLQKVIGRTLTQRKTQCGSPGTIS
jgi:Putative rhamnosyl transferase